MLFMMKFQFIVIIIYVFKKTQFYMINSLSGNHASLQGLYKVTLKIVIKDRIVSQTLHSLPSEVLLLVLH